ncbi:MAG: hypothetical protein WAO00_15085 [Chthoniobacterales bacterium]
MKIRCAVCLLLIGWPAGILRADIPQTNDKSNTAGEKTLPPRQSEARPAVPATAECENSWSLAASLNWSGVADWDLHLQTPNAHIFYGNLEDDGFTLDIDAQPICSPTPVPPEHITGNGKCGTYKVYTDLYRTCTGTPQPAFSATVTAIRPIRIDGKGFTAGQTFNAQDNVPFVVAGPCITSLEVTRLYQFTAPWGDDIYDHKAPKTMADKGCALTSLLMAMNHAGLTGETPGTLNSSATALPEGFVNGDVNWGPIAGIKHFEFAWTKKNSVTALQAAKDYLDHVLCDLERPVVVGVFNNSRGDACNTICHYVLVTGKQSDGKYTIADPGNASNTTLDAYGNRFETRGYVVPGGPRILRTSPGISGSSAIEQLFVASGGRVRMLVLDPAGHRTGIDPVSGDPTEEIPNSAYFVDSLSDDVTGEEGEASQSVYVEPPSIGRYEIRVTPSEDGPFSLLATTRSADGSRATLLSIDGIGVSGQTQVYYVSVVGNSTNFGNIATRLRVQTGDNALIGGFIVAGTQPKSVVVRALGPSLSAFGVPGVLANPTLELRDASGALLFANNDWQENGAQAALITAAGLAPGNNLESAIALTLPANNSAYTAIVRGFNNGIGIGVVEAYDVDQTVNSKLANISTRGFVNTGDNVMIGGMIVVGNGAANVLIRAIGPALTNFGVPNALSDPTLELRDASGTVLAFNDDWRTDQQAAIIATGLPPTNIRESAIVRTLSPGAYTAIVRGYQNLTGVALVEAYQLP